MKFIKILRDMTSDEVTTSLIGHIGCTLPIRSGLACGGTCSPSKRDKSTTMQFIRTVNGDWVKPTDLDDLMAVLAQLPQGTTYQVLSW